MNKMREYERGREDGLDLARRIVRQGGIEALEQECKFRGATGIHTSLAVKDLDKASEKIKEVIADSFVILSIAVRNCIKESRRVENERFNHKLLYRRWMKTRKKER